MFSSVKEIIEGLSWMRILFVIALALAFFYFTVDDSPITQKQAEIQATTARIADLQRKIKEAEEFERTLEQRRQEYQKLLQTLQETKASLPRDFFLPDLLDEVVAEAKKVGIDIKSIRPGASEEVREFYNAKKIDLSVNGSFLQLFLFLDRLAQLKRIVDVGKVSVGRDPGRKEMAVGVRNGQLTSKFVTDPSAKYYTGVQANLDIMAYRFTGAAAPATNSSPNASPPPSSAKQVAPSPPKAAAPSPAPAPAPPPAPVPNQVPSPPPAAAPLSDTTDGSSQPPAEESGATAASASTNSSPPSTPESPSSKSAGGVP